MLALRGLPDNEQCAHAFSLTADHPQRACDHMGMHTQEVGGPAFQGDGQTEANEAMTLCLSVFFCKMGIIATLLEVVMKMKRVRQNDHDQHTSGILKLQSAVIDAVMIY